MNSLNGPSIHEIKEFIKNKTQILFCLSNNTEFKGQIVWSDDNAFHISLSDKEQTVTILKSAILYYHQI